MYMQSMAFIVYPCWLAANMITSKYVEDIYWNKFRKKVHLVGSYYANISRCTVHITSKFIRYIHISKEC